MKGKQGAKAPPLPHPKINPAYFLIIQTPLTFALQKSYNT